MSFLSKTPSLSVPEDQQQTTGKPRSPSWNKGTRVQSMMMEVIQDEDVAERDLLMNLLTYLHKKEQAKVQIAICCVVTYTIREKRPRRRTLRRRLLER